MTTRVIINPGTGPVTGASEMHAAANMEAWIKDHPWDDMHFERNQSADHGKGRFAFSVWRDSVDRSACNGEHEVQMPGLPLDKVRYGMGDPDQNIWDFPRLYVDGSSWVWCYSLLHDEEWDCSDR